MVFITGWETWRGRKILVLEVLKPPPSCSVMFSQNLCKHKKQLFLPQPQHWAVPLALQPSPLLKMRMLPAATRWSLQLCRAVLLSLALLQPSSRGWRKLSHSKFALLSYLPAPAELWHLCVILEISLWCAFGHAHQYCCVNLTDLFSLLSHWNIILQLQSSNAANHWELRRVYVLDLARKQGRWLCPTSALGPETEVLPPVHSSVWFDAGMITYLHFQDCW